MIVRMQGRACPDGRRDRVASFRPAETPVRTRPLSSRLRREWVAWKEKGIHAEEGQTR
jgi:hypothetical protein